ncbi:hypothetical protein MMC07_004877 [Pseudocyphellaria aurata]|nr:hypothetical protein [Pseudocyphellaria aurata]
MSDPSHPSMDIQLVSCSKIETSSLAEDARLCPICMEAYDTTTTAATGSSEPPEPEYAVQLPCGHVMGRACFRHWLMGGSMTCPLCRANVYRLAMVVQVTDDDVTVLDIAPWFANRDDFIEVFDEIMSMLREDRQL